MNDQTTRQQKLPDEILESQKTRSDFLRWKLVLCAALGAAGLGITSSLGTSHIGLLALIPLACAYVDLLCTNINLRIILIGRHFSDQSDPYESFVGKYRIVFCLEDWALYGSTYVISGLLILLAAARLLQASVWQISSVGLECFQCIAILLTSMVAIVLTRWMQEAYDILKELEVHDEKVDVYKHFIGLLSKRSKLFKLFAKLFKIGASGADHSQ